MRPSQPNEGGLAMAIDLKPPLSTYFEATNAHDAETVAALFGETALVHDENSDHFGRTAIRQWAQGTYDKYDVRLRPENASEEGQMTIVRTNVAGQFLGSPIELKFRFVTEDEKIRELRIG